MPVKVGKVATLDVPRLRRVVHPARTLVTDALRVAMYAFEEREEREGAPPALWIGHKSSKTKRRASGGRKVKVRLEERIPGLWKWAHDSWRWRCPQLSSTSADDRKTVLGGLADVGRADAPVVVGCMDVSVHVTVQEVP